LSDLPNQEELLKFYDLAKSGESIEASVKFELPSKRYKFIRLLGKGGGKKVFEVFDNLAERKVALAMPRSKLPKHLYSSFIKEAKINAKLDHPNIIKVLDIGFSNRGVPYFTMELKRGSTLKKVIEKEKIFDNNYEKIRSKIYLFLKICDALCYAHAKGLIHVDIKPSNIQVGKFGDIMLCDWGLSQINQKETLNDLDTKTIHFDHDSYSDLTRQGKIKGTPGYMSPEQWDPERSISYQTDIFACGVLFLELLTGFLSPPSAEGVEVTLVDLEMRLSRVSLPASLKAIIKKATAQKESQRYDSMEEFKIDLERFLDGFLPMAETASWLKKSHLFYQRHKRKILTASFVLSVSLILILNLNHKFSKIEEERNSFISKETAAKEALKNWETYYKELNSHEIPDLSPKEIISSLINYDTYSKAIEIHLLANSLKYEKIKKYDKLVYSAFIYFVRQDFKNCLKCIAPNVADTVTVKIENEEISLVLIKEIAEKCIDFSRVNGMLKDDYLETFLNLCLDSGRVELAKLCLSNDFKIRYARKIYESVLPNFFDKLCEDGVSLVAYDAAEHKLELQVREKTKLRNFAETPFYLKCNHLILNSSSPIDCQYLLNTRFNQLSVHGAGLENASSLTRMRDLSIIEIDKEYYTELVDQKLKRVKVFVNASSLDFPQSIE